ncbi:retrovirus-related pol polyprotein from transposon TNT 1-94 [Tanacetum coccineum]
MSVFEVRSSDEEITPSNDRFSKVDGYHAVPSPITGNFLTQDESKTSENVGKTNEVEKSKPKINRDKVIIEDWNSDDEDDVSEVNTKEGIGFKKIKACFVCKSTDHLIKDCDFYAKRSPEPKLKTVVNTGQRVVKQVWDNAKRHNNSNHRKLSTAKPVNTARPVSTTRPVSTVRPFAPKIAQTSGDLLAPIYPRMDNVGVEVREILGSGPRQWVIHAQKVEYVDTQRVFQVEMLGGGYGCFSHMTGNKAYLSDYEDFNGGFVAFRSDPKGGVLEKDNVYCLDLNETIVTLENGVAERKNRTLIEAARTMLADSLLPIPFWAEAVNTACYVLNRVLVTKPQNKTPYELLIGNSPSISFMRPFGCPLTILNTLDSLGKFDGKSDEGYLLGYSTSSKAFRVYNKRTKRVEENLHINFLEDQPNVTGTGPNWMFDLDFLTNNYIPVSVENQVNVDASTQDSYVAVEDVAPTAHEKPSESSPKDNDVQDSEDVTDKEGQHQMPEVEQVLHDDLENMITQEVIAKALDDVTRQAFEEESQTCYHTSQSLDEECCTKDKICKEDFSEEKGGTKGVYDTLDYIETEDDQDEGRTSSVVLEEKESADKEVSIEAPISTVKPNEGTDKRNEVRISRKEKEKVLVEIRNAEDTERPRPTSTRSVLTLKPLPRLIQKIKVHEGIGKMKEEKKRLAERKKSTQGTHRTPSAPRSPNPNMDAEVSSASKRSTVIRLRIPQRRSTRLTPPALVPNVDKVDEIIYKIHYKLEPRSDKESLEVEITNVEEVKSTNAKEVENNNVVIPVNVNEEEEKITDEVYDIKRREKGKIIEESRSTPFPTPIRSHRIHTDLVSLDTDKLQELTAPNTTSTPSSSSANTKSYKDDMEVMVESLPTMVDKHIKEQVEKQIPKQDKVQVPLYVAKGLILERQQHNEEMDKMIAKAILQERGNL